MIPYDRKTNQFPGVAEFVVDHYGVRKKHVGRIVVVYWGQEFRMTTAAGFEVLF